MQFQAPNLLPALPEIFLLGMTVLVLLVELFLGHRCKKVGYVLTQFSLIGATLAAIHVYSFQSIITFHGSYVLDHAACILKIFIYATSFFVLIYSKNYIVDRDWPRAEYHSLTLLVVLGMSVLVSAANLLTLYLGLELLSLPLYALVALQTDSKLAPEAAMKYFIAGAIASGMMLYGMSMLYGMTGGLSLTHIAAKLAFPDNSHNLILLFGLVFVIVGTAFKLGAVPFHMWVPDVYDGAPNAVTLFIASATKIAAFGLAMRLLIDAFNVFHPEWQHIIIAISIASIAWGNIAAIIQTNIKRMLAYSSIAHIGYMLLGFVAGTGMGYGSAMFYIIVYAIMSLGAFGLLVLLSQEGVEATNLEDLRGLNARNPWLAFVMLLIMFSMAGIPPSAGFFAKVGVLESLISMHHVWLAALAIVFAIVGAYYYLRVVKTMYFEEPVNRAPVVIKSFSQSLAISVNGLAVLALGLLPTGLFNLCQIAFK